MNQINKGIFKGSVWLLSLRILMRGMGVISTLILVRLLTPEDFGLNAIAMSIFALIDLFSRFGFDTALIQKQDSDIDDYNTAWTLNVLFGFFAFILIILCSPYAAIFYNNENIKSVLIAVAFLFLINSFSNIGVVDFRKNLTFNKEFIFQIIPKIISFLCTIVLAFILRNFWALIFGSLIWKFSTVVVSYLMSSFRPRLSFSKIKTLFNFSKWLFINNIMQFLNTRSPELVIGKIINPSAVGLFSISNEISNMATSELVASVNRASYPGYSIVSQNSEELKNLYRGVMGSIAIWVLPAGIGLSSVSNVFVECFFGDRWTGMEDVITFLALGSMLFALNSNSGYIFLATGKPQITTYISLFRVLLFIPLFILGTIYNGVVGGAQAVLFSSFFVFIVYSFILCKYLSFYFLEFFSIFIKPLIGSLLMGGVLKWFIGSAFNISVYFSLPILVIGGACFYLIMEIVLWAIFGFNDGPEKKVFGYLISKIRTS